MVQGMDSGALAAREGGAPTARIHHHVRLKATTPTVARHLQLPSASATASAHEGGSGPHRGASPVRGLRQRRVEGRARQVEATTRRVEAIVSAGKLTVTPGGAHAVSPPVSGR